MTKGKSWVVSEAIKAKRLINSKKKFIGKRFGKLVVIEYAGKAANRNILWKCRCDCGGVIVRPSGQLTSGGVKSCGCLPKSRPPTEQAQINKLFGRYKLDAKKKSREFSLTYNEWLKLVTGPCHYCGDLEKSMIRTRRKYDKTNWVSEKCWFKYNGIDRVDSTKGYIPDNCVSCCYECNSMKSNRSLKDFRNKIAKIYNKFYRESYYVAN